MVSPSLITGEASNLSNAIKNYTSIIDELSSSWKGISYDNLSSKASDFVSKVASIISQMSAFASAIEVYKNYKNTKDNYDKNISTYNNEIRFSDDPNIIKQYLMYFNETEQEMKNMANQINNYLSEASAFTMEATSLNGQKTSGASSEMDTTRTLSNMNANHRISSEGGTFIADGEYGEYGHFYSSIDGRVHTIYRQSQISGWENTNCNRAAAASIASAYGADQALDEAKNSRDGLGYLQKPTDDYFSQFGLQADINTVDCQYDAVEDDIINTVSQGNYVMFDLTEAGARGKSNQKWTSTRHWVSVLDIKKIGDGDRDYAIYVSDSGHDGSITDYGLGEGWYTIDEFSGRHILNYTTVTSV